MIDHKIFERIFLVLLIIIVLGITILKYQSSNVPFEGEGLIDIGGYSLFIKSEGHGTPAVVFETGIGETLSFWSPVSDEIQKHTRVVTYDRAGLGKSERSPYSRTSDQKAIELHSLLSKAKIKPPYILVGSEFGVQNIRMFAARYPDEVAGIVLVDPKSENLREIAYSFLLSDEKEDYNKYIKLQYEKSTNKKRDGSFEEFLTSLEQAKACTDSMKNVLLTVVISGIDSQDPLTKAYVEDQKKLAALSNKSKVVEVANSNAYMAINETETIIQEILEMFSNVSNRK